MVNDGNGAGGGGGKGRKGPRTGKSVGIHHANIRDKEKTVKRLRSSFRKIPVKLSMERQAEPLEALIVLAELSTRSAFLFSARKLRKKTWLIFNIHHPLAMSVRAIVRYCERAQQESAVQCESDKPYFRMYIEFVLNDDAERRAMTDLYQKIRDENYVATQWHIFVTEKMQNEQRLRLQSEKLEKAIAETQKASDKAQAEAVGAAATAAAAAQTPAPAAAPAVAADPAAKKKAA